MYRLGFFFLILEIIGIVAVVASFLISGILSIFAGESVVFPSSIYSIIKFCNYLFVYSGVGLSVIALYFLFLQNPVLSGSKKILYLGVLILLPSVSAPFVFIKSTSFLREHVS